MPDHTPGPWEYGHASNYFGFYIAPRGTRPTLAAVESVHGGKSLRIECFNFPGATEANARLIAAAPDLLAYAECQEAFEREADEQIDCDEYLAVLRRHGWRGEVPADVFRHDLRRRAIAKATEAPRGGEVSPGLVAPVPVTAPQDRVE